MFDITFDRARCVRCGKCVNICAMGHLRMTDDGPAATGRGACMGCLQCAAVCPRQAVLADGRSPLETRPDDPVEALVMSRRSVRRFKPEPPERGLIEWALQRAGYAPSGKNQHANRWTVVFGKERAEAVRDRALLYCRETGNCPELIRFAEKGLDLLTCGAPVIVIAWSPDDCLNPYVDAAIAMETAELLLVSRGVGTCWGGYMRYITNACPELKAMLGIPDGCSMEACMMAGWPDDTSFPNIPTRPAPDIFWV